MEKGLLAVAVRVNTPSVSKDNFPGDCQSEAGAAGTGGTGGIQAIEFFKNDRELIVIDASFIRKDNR